jgi:hypothetical protein
MSGVLKDLKRPDGDPSNALRQLVSGPREAARAVAKKIILAAMSVDPADVDRVLKFNPYHDDHGRFSTAEEDTTPEGPAVGKPFLVYRLGSADRMSLDNKNAGNSLGVAGYIASALDDFEKPPNSSGSGDTLHAFEVTAQAPFASYSRMVGGSALDEASGGIGRVHKNGVVSYSFPKGGAWQAKHLGSVPLADVRQHLKTISVNPQNFAPQGTTSFDHAGWIVGAQAIRESFKKKVLKFNPYHDEKGRFTDAEGVGSHGYIDHPESRAAAQAIYGRAKPVEPEVSALMRTMERHGAKLQYPDKSLKGLGSLQRKILSESKKLGKPVRDVEIHDALRYTLEVPTETYTQRVTDSLRELESKGYKVYDFRNSWGPGAVYQGVNVNLKTPHGVDMELQFHTAESFHTKSKLNGKLYKKWRLDSTSKDEQDLLWARMVHNQQQVPNPVGVHGLRWTVKKGYARILKSNPNHDAHGRFAVDPSGIFDSLEEAGRQHAAHQKRYSDALDALPAGHTIKGWEHAILEGDHFWTKGKKGLSSRQLLEELGAKALEKHLPEAVFKFNPYHDAQGRFAEADSAIAALVSNPRPIAFTRGDGHTAFIHLNTRVGEGKWRVTYLTPDMQPVFHHDAEDFEQALHIADTAGYDVRHEVVQKYNPYHDELGRFTDGDSAISHSVGPKFAKHVKRMQEEYAKALAGQYAPEGQALEPVKVGDTEAMKISPKYAGWEFYQVKGAQGFEPSDFYLKDPKTGEVIYLSDAQKDHAANPGWEINPKTGDADYQVNNPEASVPVPWWKKPAPPKNVIGEPLAPDVHAALPEGFKDFTHWGKAGGEQHGGWITNPKTNESVLLHDALATKDLGKLNEMYQAVEGKKGKVSYADPSSGLSKSGDDDEQALNQRMVNESAANWASLTSTQKVHLSDYSADSTRLNAYVTGTYQREVDREPDWAFRAKVTNEQQDAHWTKRADQLDDALAHTAIPANVYSYRSVSNRVLASLYGPGDEFGSGYSKAVMLDGPAGAIKPMIGKEFKDPAYGSSSIDYNRAYNFHRQSRVMLRIRNKKGESGMYFGSDQERTSFPSEHELLLPRNTRYKIKGVKKLGSTYVIDVWKIGAKKAKKQPQPVVTVR